MQDDLIARIEAAEGPDRELDAEILAVIADTKNGSVRCGPVYTGSLDDGMTLVPEGWDHMEVYCPDHQTLGWTVHLMPNANLGRETWEGFAQSFPLALCAAALRARAAMGGGDD